VINDIALHTRILAAEVFAMKHCLY